jgi:hypothetical protein
MKCEVCSFEIGSNRELLKHLKSEHDMTAPVYFKENSNAVKFCSKCREAKEISNFLVDKGNNYGHRAQCIECMKPGGNNRPCPICNRVMRWSAIITHMRDEHEIPPESGYFDYLKEKLCPKCNMVKSLNSYAKLKDSEKVFFSYCNDCNLERNIARNVSNEEYDSMSYLVTRLSFNDTCFSCGLSHNESMKKFEQPLHVDHLVAHAKGEGLSIHNAILLCQTCNIGKGTKALSEFLEYKGFSRSAIEEMMIDIQKRIEWAKSELKRALIRQSYQNPKK